MKFGIEIIYIYIEMDFEHKYFLRDYVIKKLIYLLKINLYLINFTV